MNMEEADQVAHDTHKLALYPTLLSLIYLYMDTWIGGCRHSRPPPLHLTSLKLSG